MARRDSGSLYQPRNGAIYQVLRFLFVKEQHSTFYLFLNKKIKKKIVTKKSEKSSHHEDFTDCLKVLTLETPSPPPYLMFT